MTQNSNQGAVKQVKISGAMRVETGSALSAAASPEKVKQDKNSSVRKNINTTLRHKQGNNVPETFLVPMVLRKTKLKQKQ